jgi:MoxR-like ATPase
MRPSAVAAVLETEFLTPGAHTPVMLWGPPGVGKSQLVAAIAARHGAGVVDIRLAQMEPTDLRGIPFRRDDGVVWSAPALLPRAERDPPRGILFLDELSSAPPTVTAAAYQLILDRRLGEYRVPDAWVIFAAGNRQGDRGVTYQMPAPLANRFTHYEVEPDLDDWVAWAEAQGIDPRIIAFLRFRPDLLFDFDPAHYRAAFPSPRSWEFAHRALEKFASRRDLLREALAACVGAPVAAEFYTFCEHLRQLPDIAAIARGESVPVPVGIDLQYGLAAALVHHTVRLRGAERERAAAHVLRFAHHLRPRELGVMLVMDLQRGFGRPLIDLPDFAAWAAAVGDLVTPVERRGGAT